MRRKLKFYYLRTVKYRDIRTDSFLVASFHNIQNVGKSSNILL